MGENWPHPPAEWTGAINAKKEQNVARMAARLGKTRLIDNIGVEP